MRMKPARTLLDTAAPPTPGEALDAGLERMKRERARIRNAVVELSIRDEAFRRELLRELNAKGETLVGGILPPGLSRYIDALLAAGYSNEAEIKKLLRPFFDGDARQARRAYDRHTAGKQS